MPTLLHLDSSADLVRSRSRAITAVFADTWRQAGPDHTVTYRHLHRDPLPHLADPEQHSARLDHIHVPGVTAPLDTDTRPLAGRTAVIVNSSGAIYDPGLAAEAAQAQLEFDQACARAAELGRRLATPR